MIWYRREPTLEEMLSDSVVQAVMAADGVDPLALEVMLKEVGRNVSLARHARLWGPQAAPSYEGRLPANEEPLSQ